MSMLIQKKLPFDLSSLQSSYTLDDGTKIYIEQFERGDRIWEYNSKDKSFLGYPAMPIS